MDFPIGIDDFKELVEGDYYFVDKSLFIKDVVTDGSKVILITRPRRFGKTLNMSMLYHFLKKDHAETLFEGSKIAEDVEFCNTHQGQYPVIFITFKDVKRDTYDSALGEIKDLMRKLYVAHIDLLEGNTLLESEKKIYQSIIDQTAEDAHLTGAIQALSEYMHKKFKQEAMILIDEYDTPIQEAYLKGYYDEMISLMRGIFGKALKGNSSLKKAVVTGIARVAQESLFSGVNNFDSYGVLQEQYGQYFGFTEEEVVKLSVESHNTASSIADIKEWYNGYQVGRYTLYNPWSIIKCLKQKGELACYWINTGGDGLINELLKQARPGVKQQLEELLQGNVLELPLSENLVFPNLATREEALWSLLLYAGYLKVLFREYRDYELIAKIAIPNKEVGFVYKQIIMGWFQDIMGRSPYLRFVQSLEEGNMDEFKRYLSDYIMQAGSYNEFNNKTSEKTFHVFVLGLVIGLRDRYVIHSNQEGGFGRFDVILIPKDKNKNRDGILLEFKVSETPELMLKKAEEGLGQIKDQRYVERFKQEGVGGALIIGVAFCGKALELASERVRF